MPAMTAGLGRTLLTRAAYYERVLATQPAGYWPVWESAGTVARCLVNVSQNGTYNSAVNTWPPGQGIGDGHSAPFFDGANDYVNIYTAALNAAYDRNEGSVMIWWKVANAGAWTDGTGRYGFNISWAASTEYDLFTKDIANNQYTHNHYASGANHNLVVNPFSSVEWNCSVMTRSAAANQTRFYRNGAELLPAAACAAAAGGVLDVPRTMIGARFTTPLNPWHGWLAHFAYWNRALPPAEIAGLSSI